MEDTVQHPVILSDRKLVAFLRDRQPLLSTEKAHIRSAIPGLREKLHQHSIRVQALKSALHVFESEHACVEAKLQKYEAVFAPIRHVPNEVLLEIFRLCILSLPIWEDGAFDRNINVRWRLTRVCHAWRELIQHCPSLWDTVVLLDSAFPTLKPAKPAMRRYLEMSGRLPLRVTYHDGLGNCRDGMRSLAKTLFKTSSRWKVLRMQIDFGVCADRSHKLEIYRKFDKTAIEELHLNFAFSLEELEDAQQVEIIRAFIEKALPEFISLRRADLSCHIFFQLAPVKLSRTVTHLAIPSHSQALHYLRVMPNLLELHFDYRVQGSSNFSAVPLRHGTLRVLRMCQHYPTLDSLTLPALEELAIDFDQHFVNFSLAEPFEVNPAHLDTLVAFIKRSKCRLNSLILFDCNTTLDPRLVNDILDPLADSLTCLGLSLVVPTQPEWAYQMRRMVQRPDRKGSLPFLKYLELQRAKVAQIEGETPSADMLEAVSEFILSRCDPLMATKWGTAVLKGVRTGRHTVEYSMQLKDICMRRSRETAPVFFESVDYGDWDGRWADRTSLPVRVGIRQDESVH